MKKDGKGDSGNQLIISFCRYLKNYKLHCCALSLCILLTLSTLAFQPIIWSSLLSTLYRKNFEQFKVTLIITVIFYLLKILISYLQSRVTIYLKVNLVRDLQNNLFQKLLNKQMKYFDNTPIGKTMSVLSTDIEQAVEILFGKLLPASVSCLQVLLFLILMLNLSFLLTLFSLLSLPVIIIYYNKKMRQVRSQQVDVKESNDSVLSFIQQSILGMKVVKTLGVKEAQNTQFTNLVNFKKKNVYSLQTLIVIFQTFISMLGVLGEIANYLLGGYFVFIGSLTVEGFIQFSSYSQEFNSSSLSVTNIAGSYQQLLVSLDRIESIKNNGLDDEHFGDVFINDYKNPSLKLVDVKCEKMGRIILDDINLELNDIGLYVFMGDSGSGKTTLINHILKLYDVMSGEILINDKSIDMISEKSLRDEISLVNQQVFSFCGSIIDNFRYVSPRIKLSEIRDYCSECGIDREIMDLPKQYETKILENGNNFSVGQLQRLSIAIALAKDTSIIVFDEPTSALDSSNRLKIKAIIDRLSLSKMVILITHDTDIVENAVAKFSIKEKQIYQMN